MAILFDSLSQDVQHQILSYLTPVSVGNGRLAKHPFLVLSTINQAFNTAVESFCYHQLNSTFLRLGATKKSLPAPPFTSHRRPTYRGVFLLDASRRCRVCRASTKRRAAADTSIMCCRHCDRLYRLSAAAVEAVPEVAAEFGIPEDLLLARLSHGGDGELKMLPRDELTEMALAIHEPHGVRDIDMYMDARKTIVNHAEKDFLPVAARLWREQKMRLVMRRIEWKLELDESEMSPAEVDAEIAFRRAQWDRECDREKEIEWHALYPWYRDIAKQNEEIYKHIKQEREKRKAVDVDPEKGKPIEVEMGEIPRKSECVDLQERRKKRDRVAVEKEWKRNAVVVMEEKAIVAE